MTGLIRVIFNDGSTETLVTASKGCCVYKLSEELINDILNERFSLYSFRQKCIKAIPDSFFTNEKVEMKINHKIILDLKTKTYTSRIGSTSFSTFMKKKEEENGLRL